MSVRSGLLALLTEQPMHGYQLRQEFEARTGGTWPLNIGQVYTTLARLERDGLVESASQGDADSPEHQDSTRSAGEKYQLTSAGRTEINNWWSTPVLRGAPARDELPIKLALAVTVSGVDVVAVLQRQRTETMRVLRDYTLLKKDADASLQQELEVVGTDLAWSLVLDNLIFAAEAELRWLDHVETRLTLAAAATTIREQKKAEASAPETTSNGAQHKGELPRPNKEPAPKKPSIKSILEKLEAKR